jgi:hypothetical protein
VRILVSHVDNGSADLDLSRSGPYRGQQWERRRQLSREVVNAEVRPIHSETLGFYGKVNRLQKDISRRLGL